MINVTPWAFPNKVSQHAEAETHVAWDPGGIPYLRIEDGKFIRTVAPLTHTTNSLSGNRLMKTWYLVLSDFKFNFIPEAFSGIEVKLRMQRGGRITDETIQLMYNGQAVGENRAESALGLTNIYGGTIDSWSAVPTYLNEEGTLCIVPEVGRDPTLGVCIRFQSHPSIPHKETPMLDYVKMRLIGVTAADAARGNIPKFDGEGSDSAGLGSSRPGGFGPGGGTGDAGLGTDPGTASGRNKKKGKDPQDVGGTIKPGFGSGYISSTFSGSTGYGGTTGGGDTYQGSTGYYGSIGYLGSGYTFGGYVASYAFLNQQFGGELNTIIITEDTGQIWLWTGAYWADITGQV